MPITEGVWPAGQTGVGCRQVTFDRSQSKAATQRPTRHCGWGIGSANSVHFGIRQVGMLHGGGVSPGASAMQLQQSSWMVQSLAIVHSAASEPPWPEPP
jgi:hypothetical protein